MSEKSVPVVLSISNDLFFGMRIKNSVEQMKFELRWIESESEFKEAHRLMLANNEKTKWLILLDLSSKMDWQGMLSQVKNNNVLANIPWIAYGSHVNVDILAKAEELGADQVMAKSKFTKRLPEILLNL